MFDTAIIHRVSIVPIVNVRKFVSPNKTRIRGTEHDVCVVMFRKNIFTFHID